MMKQNVGILDTAIRSTLACILVALAVEGLFSIPVSIAMATIGALLWVSCAFGICLVYKLLGMDTYPDFRDDSFHASH